MTAREAFKKMSDKIDIKKLNGINYTNDRDAQIDLFVNEAIKKAKNKGISEDCALYRDIFNNAFENTSGDALGTIKQMIPYMHTLYTKIRLCYINNATNDGVNLL